MIRIAAALAVASVLLLAGCGFTASSSAHAGGTLGERQVLLQTIDTYAQKISGRPTPGIIPLNEPYQSATTFGMDEVDFNRVRLYTYTKVLGEAKLDQSKDGKWHADMIKGIVERGVGEAEEHWGFTVTARARDNFILASNSLFSAKVMTVSERPRVDLSKNPTRIEDMPDVLDRLILYPEGKCGHFAMFARVLNLHCGYVGYTDEIIQGLPVPDEYIMAVSAGGQVRFELAPSSGTYANHGWTSDRTVVRSAGKSEFFDVVRDPIYAYGEFFRFKLTHNSNDIERLGAVVGVLHTFDALTPEAREMFAARNTHFIETDDFTQNRIVPLTSFKQYREMDLRGLQPSYDFYKNTADEILQLARTRRN